MIATAWTNGTSGLGVKISVADRDRYFHREWGAVLVELEGESEPISCNIDKDSFWSPACRELISAQIGRWLLSRKLAPWVKGSPPKLTLTPLDGNRFRLQEESNASPG